VVDGRFALRVCIVNFRTTAADIDALLTLLVRFGREVDAELSGFTLRLGGSA
jgi:aromatic-L-amino-acid/L-tryptophan decarboxylase